MGIIKKSQQSRDQQRIVLQPDDEEIPFIDSSTYGYCIRETEKEAAAIAVAAQILLKSGTVRKSPWKESGKIRNINFTQ